MTTTANLRFSLAEKGFFPSFLSFFTKENHGK